MISCPTESITFEERFVFVAVATAVSEFLLCPVGEAYVGIDQMANLYIVYDNECIDEIKGIHGVQCSGRTIRPGPCVPL
jgi:hypothetical protein